MTVIKFIGYLFGIACALFLVVAVGIGVYLGNVAKDLPDYEVLAQYTPPVTTRVYAGNGELMAEYAHERRLFLPIDAIPMRVRGAFLSAEDKNFYTHPGIDVVGLARAVFTNVKNMGTGRRPVGASTITQQVAKNFLLSSDQTYERKVKEAILSFRIEQAYSKDTILELYLNVIEYGPAVYGIVHAADYYFGRAPAELSPAESAFLAVILPNPKRYHESYERGELTRSMRNRVTRFLRHMHARERIDAEALAHGLAQLEDFRFHRPGEPVQARTLQGRAADLPFASGVPGLWGPGGEPLDDMGEGEGEGAEREAVEVEPSGAERRLAP